MSNKSAKKAIVLAKQKKQRQIKVIIASVAAVAVLALAVVLFAKASSRNQVSPNTLANTPTFGASTRAPRGNRGHANVTPVGGKITFDAADFSGGQAAYFTTEAAGKDINFFILESSDGVIRAAFDACDVCYQAKKGYSQSGDLMVCNNCGQQFHSVRINEEKGGCNPSPLDRHMEDGHVVINIADIEKGAMYF